jgi:hypothetical protein
MAPMQRHTLRRSSPTSMEHMGTTQQLLPLVLLAQWDPPAPEVSVLWRYKIHNISYHVLWLFLCKLVLWRDLLYNVPGNLHGSFLCNLVLCFSACLL